MNYISILHNITEKQKMGFKGSGKSTTGALAIRRNEVMELILNNKTTAKIIKEIRGDYNISMNAVQKDLQYCYAEIKRNRPDVEDLINMHLEKYNKIAERASEEYDNATVIKALQAKEKLLRLWTPEVVVNNNTQNNHYDLKDISFKELKSLIKNE